jgi:hypothetical protein
MSVIRKQFPILSPATALKMESTASSRHPERL